jgi:glucose uptake protein
MVIIQSYPVAVLLCLLTMLCWGSWANTMKLTGKRWYFQLYYWDYALGVLLFSLIFAFTLGSSGEKGRSFLEDISQAQFYNLLRAFLAGALFNLSNILLVTVISIAGMAIAFPIGVGLALVLGVISGYMTNPVGNPWLLFSGLACVVVAIVFDGKAYSLIPVTGSKSVRKGIFLSILTGIFMGFFYPILVGSISSNLLIPEKGKLTPYTAIVLFSTGLFISSFVFNTYLMNKPITGEKILFKDYLRNGSWKDHGLGFFGGLVWCLGFSLMTLSAEKAGTAISYGLGQGATMIAVLWGVLVWKEFKLAPRKVNKYLLAMLLFYLGGLSLIIIAKQ